MENVPKRKRVVGGEPKLEIEVSQKNPPPKMLDVQTLPDLSKISDAFVARSLGECEQYAQMGATLERNGSVRVGNGMLLISNASLVAAIRKMREDMESGSDPVVAASAMAKLGASVARISQEFRKNNESTPGKKGKRQGAFDLGKPVALTQNNYYVSNQNEPTHPTE